MSITSCKLANEPVPQTSFNLKSFTEPHELIYSTLFSFSNSHFHFIKNTSVMRSQLQSEHIYI